jgi:hypothetical protein
LLLAPDHGLFQGSNDHSAGDRLSARFAAPGGASRRIASACYGLCETRSAG